ncbi:MAG: alpha/beta hydrolase [Dehalococcoidales bacterium]|nr:alpha/beta hydrolase [Dehalococcoidales bacterium]
MTIANINGVDMYYEVAGQGNTIVFLHGMTGSTRDWASQISLLSPKYRVIARDQRGHGKSAAPAKEEQYSVPIFADDVFALLKKLDIKKCCLVGHSIGGFTALQFALEHPDMLAALVLVDTSSGQFARDPSFAPIKQKTDELARSQGMAAAFEYDVANNPTRKERIKKHPELKEVTRRKMLQTSVNGYLYGSSCIGKWQPVTSRLAEIKVPTLICWGDEDVGFTEAVQILKKGIAGSELVTFKGAGHNPHEEATGAFNAALLKFLNKVKW